MSTTMAERLGRMAKERRAVRAVRRIPGADALEGYVLAVGSKWVLLSLVDDNRPNGFAVVRVADLERVAVLGADTLYRRALKANGLWPPAVPEGRIDLDSTRRLIRSVHRTATLVNLQVERVNPEICFIGVPIGWGSRSVLLEEITPRAKWDGTLSRWRFRDITRVDFGSAYERDLLLVGGIRS